ncbi:hypothetical protein UPYG_G00095880 [Umbra pygmaea]|uniref:B30.2/SPRY domain-containing protein n=1 Tax=Umbra pygmaea TaxID=75934 RepID=A0ABD0XPM8_UMBPY
MSHSGEIMDTDPASKMSHSGEIMNTDPASKMSHSGEIMDTDPASKMSDSGEIMNTDPASKMSLSGHKENKANSTIHQERPASFVPSCVSMKSDCSINLPLTFRKEPNTDHQERSKSNILSGQTAQSHPTYLSSIFSSLEQNIMTFIKKELKRFKTILSSDLPEGFEGQRKDEEVVDSEDGKQESSAKEGALKITLHFLRNMNQEQLADTLEESELAVNLQPLRLNPSHLKKLDLSYNHPGDSGVTLLSAGLKDPTWTLENLNVDHGGENWLKSGLKKYVCDLTLDPNTVNRKLCLSEENRKVTWSKEKQPYPDHPERFDYWPQVLCREGLTGRCYWEVERSGVAADIGVTYKGINRRGRGYDC